MAYNDNDVGRLYFSNTFNKNTAMRDIATLTGRTIGDVKRCVEKYESKMSCSARTRADALDFIAQRIEDGKSYSEIFNDFVSSKMFSDLDYNDVYAEATRNEFSTEKTIPPDIYEKVKIDIAGGVPVQTVIERYNLRRELKPFLYKVQSKANVARASQETVFDRTYTGLVELGISRRTGADLHKEEEDYMTQVGKLVKDNGKYTAESLTLLRDCIKEGLSESETLKKLEIPTDKKASIRTLYKRLRAEMANLSEPIGQKVVKVGKIEKVGGKYSQESIEKLRECKARGLSFNETCTELEIPDANVDGIRKIFYAIKVDGNDKTEFAETAKTVESVKAMGLVGAAGKEESDSAVKVEDYKKAADEKLKAQLDYIDCQIKACAAELELLKDIRKSFVEINGL